jgi:hypothetical protein
MQTLYDKNFYDTQIVGSSKSAHLFIKRLMDFIEINSVVDIGCGRGAWLDVCLKFGGSMAVGYDGDWNSQEQMINKNIIFRANDLNTKIASSERFDLSMSLEVAEHIKPENSDLFLDNLTQFSDVVLFGAAFTGQPGTDHINCNPHSFWAFKMRERGYYVFNFLREEFWQILDVEPWYYQNTFLYVKSGNQVIENLKMSNIYPLKNLYSCNSISQWLYDSRKNSV